MFAKFFARDRLAKFVATALVLAALILVDIIVTVNGRCPVQ